MEDYKFVLKQYIIPYLQKQGIKVKRTLQAFDCPFCGGKKSAQIIPGHSLNCHQCKPKEKHGDFFQIPDLVRKFENRDYSDEEAYQIIRKMFNVKTVTKKDKEDLKSYLDFYVKNSFDLVPIANNKKFPVEKNWTNKHHKDKDEWEQWLADGLNIGVKTGTKSGITVIDIDQKPIPEEIKNTMGETLMQETTKGYHLFYKYDKEFPKTRIDEYKIDVENEGGQVVIYPSRIDGIERKIQIRSIIEMPKELKKLLKEKITVPRKTQSEELREAIKTEDFKIDPSKFALKNNNLEGCCNSEFIKLGGILRKKLNTQDTGYVLNVLNNHMLERPMDTKSIRGMIRELDKYQVFDEQELSHQVMEYLKQVEEASRNEVALAVVGNNRGTDKKRIDKVLKYLVTEGYLLKKGTRYGIIKKLEWQENLIETGKPVDFKVPYFKNVANFNYGDLVLIGSKNKRGKCFAKGTGILMYDGSIKKVENIIPGDKVMGIDSTSRNVLDIAGGREIMYEIIPCRGESFTVNESHILSLKKVGTEKIINISIKDFLKKDKTFRKTHYLYRVPIEFNPKYVSIDPYYLGLWLGDGDKTNVRITTKDNEIINYLEKYAQDCGQTLQEYKYSNRCPSYAITHGHQGRQISTIDSLQVRLKELGVLNNKHIPFEYKTNCRELRLKLLAGLIDSDGYLTEKKTAYEITITNKRLAKDIVYLARSLGFFSYIRKRKAIATNWNYSTTAYRISILGNVTQIPIKIKRKKALPRKSNRNPLVTKFTIKKLKEGYYYGFTIDGDHLHLIDSFIVNHNTHISMNIVKQLVEQGIKPYYISLETGSRFAKIALQLGLKEGDFYHAFCSDPTKIEIEPNAVTIIDWLLVIDKSKTDLVFRHFVEQLYKTKGFLICFQQLKQDDQYFAPNMAMQFPALSARYIYDNDDDGEYGQFKVDVVREPKIKIKTYNVPCRYDWETKRLETTENWQKRKEKEANEIHKKDK